MRHITILRGRVSGVEDSILTVMLDKCGEDYRVMALDNDATIIYDESFGLYSDADTDYWYRLEKWKSELKWLVEFTDSRPIDVKGLH